MSAAIKDQVWSDRKKYFFKPKNAFGSKQTFRGSSISRKAFEDICNENFIAQEFLSPGEVSFELNQETYNFKYPKGEEDGDKDDGRNWPIQAFKTPQ